MNKVTVEKLYKNRFNPGREIGEILKNPTTEDMIGIRNYHCFIKLQEDISKIVNGEEVMVEYDDSEYSITIKKNLKSGSNTSLTAHISLFVESESLDYVNITLEDPRARNSTKNFHIETRQGNNTGGYNFNRIKNSICTYLKDGQGSWILKND